MIAMARGQAAGASYWIVAGLAAVWNALGCLDYVMTASRNTAYLAQTPPDIVDWLDSMPTWVLLPWAAGVGGGLAGGLLLLLRSRRAVAAFAISLAGLAITQAWRMTSDIPAPAMTAGMMTAAVMTWTIAIGLLWFAWNNRREGVLR